VTDAKSYQMQLCFVSVILWLDPLRMSFIGLSGQAVMLLQENLQFGIWIDHWA